MLRMRNVFCRCADLVKDGGRLRHVLDKGHKTKMHTYIQLCGTMGCYAVWAAAMQGDNRLPIPQALAIIGLWQAMGELWGHSISRCGTELKVRHAECEQFFLWQFNSRLEIPTGRPTSSKVTRMFPKQVPGQLALKLATAFRVDNYSVHIPPYQLRLSIPQQKRYKIVTTEKHLLSWAGHCYPCVVVLQSVVNNEQTVFSRTTIFRNLERVNYQDLIGTQGD